MNLPAKYGVNAVYGEIEAAQMTVGQIAMTLARSAKWAEPPTLGRGLIRRTRF
jgi:hypothetical protein